MELKFVLKSIYTKHNTAKGKNTKSYLKREILSEHLPSVCQAATSQNNTK